MNVLVGARSFRIPLLDFISKGTMVSGVAILNSRSGAGILASELPGQVKKTGQVAAGFGRTTEKKPRAISNIINGLGWL